MKVYYMGIWRFEGEPAELCSANDLKATFGFFGASTAGQMVKFAVDQVVKKVGVTGPGKLIMVDDQEHSCKIYAWGLKEGACGAVVTDMDYPAHVATAIVRKITDEFVQTFPRSSFIDVAAKSTDTCPFPRLNEYIKQYQDPANADSITKIQGELDEAKKVMHKSVEALLERGEKIDSLVAKSDILSSQSKMFYTQAKKQNSCCNVM